LVLKEGVIFFKRRLLFFFKEASNKSNKIKRTKKASQRGGKVHRSFFFARFIKIQNTTNEASEARAPKGA